VLRGWGEELLRRDNRQEEEEKETYPPAGTSLQGFAHRYNYSCEEKPVGKYLQALACLVNLSYS
jgi:hypothetical protein